MIFVFYILSILLIYLSFKSFRGGINYLNYFKRELARPRSDYMPFATIIAPCKGLDNELESNLTALMYQDYPAYEVIFVVDDANDPAVAVIEQISRTNATETKLVVAQKAVGSGQKVENLREAVLRVSDRSEVFVFADSDARPAVDWLQNLVAPLRDETIGASSGYRWFISRNPTFASELRSVWNASIASALGPNEISNFCWGGSMAIRRETFLRLDIREKWRGTLSDDFTASRAVRDAGQSIKFVPKALTASVENCTIRELFEFTTRQIKITRVYAPNLWVASLLGSGLFNSVMISAFLIVILSDRNDLAVISAFVTLTLVSLSGIGKSMLRLRAVWLVLTEYRPLLRKQIPTQGFLWLLAPALFFFNGVSALFSRKIIWRGIAYRLHSPDKTVVETPSNEKQHVFMAKRR